jgi:hypothetical protein
LSKDIQQAEIFSTGSWNGMAFTESDLDAIVSSFGSRAVPLKLGHDRGVPDGQPAVGWVRKVWRDGKKLFADFVDMPTTVFEAIRKGLYKQVSIELVRGRDGNPWVLDAVALLGADIPAVKDLRDLDRLLHTAKADRDGFGNYAAQFGYSDSMSCIVFSSQVHIQGDPTMTTDRTHLAGKTVSEVLTTLAENECLKHGGKITDYTAMAAATHRVLRGDPKLARAYQYNPSAPYGQLE